MNQFQLWSVHILTNKPELWIGVPSDNTGKMTTAIIEYPRGIHFRSQGYSKQPKGIHFYDSAGERFCFPALGVF